MGLTASSMLNFIGWYLACNKLKKNEAENGGKWRIHIHTLNLNYILWNCDWDRAINSIKSFKLHYFGIKPLVWGSDAHMIFPVWFLFFFLMCTKQFHIFFHNSQRMLNFLFKHYLSRGSLYTRINFKVCRMHYIISIWHIMLFKRLWTKHSFYTVLSASYLLVYLNIRVLWNIHIVLGQVILHF